MRIDHMTPDGTILKELGDRLARVRKQQGHSQQVLSKAAGVGVATLRRIEDGKDAQLGSWIKILRALQLESSIDSLLPETFRSPMAEALSDEKRARRRGNKTLGSGFSWRDERP